MTDGVAPAHGGHVALSDQGHKLEEAKNKGVAHILPANVTCCGTVLR